MAKPFFRSFINRIQEEEGIDYENEAEFIMPFGGPDIETDCDRYKLLQRGQNTIEEFDETEYFEDPFQQ